ncbi:hypothetical protein OsI_09108 [Oryza sativa Indica Group]|uniref:Uncharacterized protein n=1 Tax=Oryza sativa subsp. indica TaxID=39946 RepID=A2XA33_ORYSI|nr:hypothetical protein OsI_09108 [Oryza sativa Indica Group]
MSEFPSHTDRNASGTRMHDAPRSTWLTLIIAWEFIGSPCYSRLQQWPLGVFEEKGIEEIEKIRKTRIPCMRRSDNSLSEPD